MDALNNASKSIDYNEVVLGVVIVDYKTAERTVDFVTTELSKISVIKRIVIVNNACTPESNAQLARGCGGQLVTDDGPVDLSREVFLLSTEQNLGYAKGNNLGARFLKRYFGVPYILFSNNDLRLINANVVDHLIRVAEQHDDVGAIGPRIIDSHGENQSPMKYCSIWTRIILPYAAYPLFYPFLRAGFLSDMIPHAPFGFYYRLMGCFLLVKASVFEAVQGFDEGTFLYAEEMILSERLANFSMKMCYEPAVVVVHEHSQVISKHMTKLCAMQLRLQSEVYFYKKYKNISRFEEVCSTGALFLLARVYSPIVRFVKKILYSVA